jgi:hydroxyethylthiazole kinase-like uncharacterized protein yjeF
MTAPLPVLSRETVRLLDRLSIEKCGIPGVVLMENAGNGCALLIANRVARGAWSPPVLVLAGPGSNGGDGYVIARHLHNQGIPSTVALVGHAHALRPGSDAATNAAALRGTGVPWFESPVLGPELEAAIGGAGCFVDALFGTGLDRPLAAWYGHLFAAIESTRKPVLAVDIPSGLDAETGAILGAALHATATATFAAAKPGLVRGAGPEFCGEIVLVSISIPRRLLAQARENEAAFRQWAQKMLDDRAADPPENVVL